MCFKLRSRLISTRSARSASPAGFSNHVLLLLRRWRLPPLAPPCYHNCCHCYAAATATATGTAAAAAAATGAATSAYAGAGTAAGAAAAAAAGGGGGGAAAAAAATIHTRGCRSSRTPSRLSPRASASCAFAAGCANTCDSIRASKVPPGENV